MLHSTYTVEVGSTGITIIGQQQQPAKLFLLPDNNFYGLVLRLEKR